MQPYELNILLNYDKIHKILLDQINNSKETDIEIDSNTIKFYFPIPGMPNGMFAHAPEDDVTNESWIKDLREFVRATCTLNTGTLVNTKDLGNVKYTLPAITLIEKIEQLKNI